MIKWLKKQLDKLHHCGNDLAQWGAGRWYVRYPDGKRSVAMHYGTAKNYADIFGGKVFHVEDQEAV